MLESDGSSAKAMQHNYRPDIDGLRAVAVLSVVIFHAFPTWLPGGLVGVDIFFVISGYLISGHILQQLHDNKFSIFDFYSRRIRRIFPALILVLLFCLAVGAVALSAADNRELGEHVAGGRASLPICSSGSKSAAPRMAAFPIRFCISGRSASRSSSTSSGRSLPGSPGGAA
ncbi:acyltransferase [Rhizobium sp. BG4]|uniref:acyltransferase family protein n=1 Tax=Rhizobium sp. BG4 TaxID=2613770 RepID=UPI00193E927A|nr:acyltransferase [Rhizobium sp. BG4]